MKKKPAGVPFLDLGRHHRPFAAAFRKKFDELVRTSQFVLGAEVTEFEKEFAASVGVKHCVGVSNGTDALRLACEAIGLKSGDEVVVPAYTFIATAFGVTSAGGIPRFVDVSEDTFNLDPEKLEAAIGPRTRAILPVHLFGHPADMDPVLEIAKRRGLRVIEDAAQAHGADYKGRKAGSMGDLGCFSFYPTKNLSALGDAGAITTNDDALADRLRVRRNLGQRKRYVHELVGANNRLDNLQAALLRLKLPKLGSFNALRRRAAGAYAKALKGLPGLRLPQERPGCVSSWHVYSILHERRDEAAAALQAAGIGHGIYYSIPLPFQECYRGLGHRKGDFPVSEHLAERSLALPMFPEITAAEIGRVAKALKG
jgi:dTDP-4-amino-4,6-dideoxygalactose transaminase